MFNSGKSHSPALCRSDPTALSGFSGADAPAPQVSQDAAGEKVVVSFMSMAKVREMEAAEEAAKAASQNGSSHTNEQLKDSSKRKREDPHSSDREPSGSGKRDGHEGSSANGSKSRNHEKGDEDRSRNPERHKSRDDRGREKSPAQSSRHGSREAARGSHHRSESDRGRHRDSERDRRYRSSSRERTSKGSKRHRDDHRGKDRDKRQRQESHKEQEPSKSVKTHVKEPAPVILESSKEGKVKNMRA